MDNKQSNLSFQTSIMNFSNQVLQQLEKGIQPADVQVSLGLTELNACKMDFVSIKLFV